MTSIPIDKIPPLRARAPEPESRRTLQKVRRRSRLAGREYGSIWNRVTLSRGQSLKAAETFDNRRRKKGERWGPLGPVALELYRELWSRVNFKTGRLDPTYETMAGWIRRSEKAVARALRLLQRHGFIDWIRRYVPGDDEGQRGPQVVQTSNAYWLKVPDAAMALLGLRHRPPPIPDDQVTANQEAAIARAFMDQDAKSEWFDTIPGVDRAKAKALASSPPLRDVPEASQSHSVRDSKMV